MGYVLWPVGIGLVLVGMAIRIWSQQHVRYRMKVARDLTTSGPYSFVRNPVYIANMVIWSGAVVASGLLWFTPIALVYWLGVYCVVVRHEESRLLEKYGEAYRQYVADVPRWFPRLGRLADLEMVNKYFVKAVAVEIHCPLILVPYVLKDFMLS